MERTLVGELIDSGQVVIVVVVVVVEICLLVEKIVVLVVERVGIVDDIVNRHKRF